MAPSEFVDDEDEESSDVEREKVQVARFVERITVSNTRMIRKNIRVGCVENVVAVVDVHWECQKEEKCCQLSTICCQCIQFKGKPVNYHGPVPHYLEYFDLVPKP